MGKLNSGDLQERVVLLTTAAPVKDPNGYGYNAAGPDEETAVWARVRPLRVDQKVRLGQVNNQAGYEITIRRRPDVSAKQRVRWGEVELDIQGVTPDENREFLRLTCFDGGQ
jgi:SPP1 family predicted phage head-tail adaptor